MIQQKINKHMDIKKMYAVWRVDPPWKPISKKAHSKKMGGGKAPIHHYVTPVRAGSIIVEIGGHIELEDCAYFLEAIMAKLPCDTYIVTKELLEQWKKEEEQQAKMNINPINYEYAVKNNMAGCHKWISPYDHRWYNKYK